MNQSNHPEMPFNLMNILDDDTEFIPLLSQEDEATMNKQDIPEVLAILPLRNTVLFPGVVIPITVGRDRSINLIKDAYKGDKIIGVIAQKDVSVEDPKIEDLHVVGTVATVLKMLRMPDGNTTIIIQGKRRFEIVEQVQSEPYITCRVRALEEIRTKSDDKEFMATVDSLKDLALQIIQNSPNIPSDAAFAIRNIESPSFLINFISSNMNLDVHKKQELLEISDHRKRATNVLEYLTKELQMLELKNQIQNKVRVDIDKQQREYFLNQQLRTIQEELGGTTPDREVAELRERARSKKWTKETAEVFDRECDRLSRMNPAAAEYSILVNYLELMLDLPWNEFTQDNFDLKNAQKVLDKDHYGLEKIKERILEYLAVQQRVEPRECVVAAVAMVAVVKTDRAAPVVGERAGLAGNQRIVPGTGRQDDHVRALPAVETHAGEAPRITHTSAARGSAGFRPERRRRPSARGFP